MTDTGTGTEKMATVTAIMKAIEGLDGVVAAPIPVELDRRAVKELPAEAQEAIEAFDAAKKMKKYASDQKDYWEEKLRDYLEGAEVGTLNGHPVLKVNHSHTSYNKAEILRTAYPEAYEASHVESPYTYLTVVK